MRAETPAVPMWAVSVGTAGGLKLAVFAATVCAVAGLIYWVTRKK